MVIINGFLGSGKTTLLKNLLGQAYRTGLGVGVVVNDMSEIDVDGMLLAQTELSEEHRIVIESIHNCVLSSANGIERLGGSLRNILSGNHPDLIIIETSGSCHPMPLIEFFSDQLPFKLTGVLVLVDGAMIAEDYQLGQDIVPRMQRNLAEQRRDTTNLLVEQLMFSSHMMLTKADRLKQREVQSVAKSIHGINPTVSVTALPWGNLAIDDVLAMPGYDFHRIAQLQAELKPALAQEEDDDRPYHLATSVIEDDRPFHPQRLWETCQAHLGQHIYRSKGFFYLASRDHVSLLWNQAAGGVALELIGYWRAGVLEDENHGLDDTEIAGLKERLANEPGRFGDRRCQLTVIGDHTQVDWFADALRRCFLTDDEIAFWQAGGEFADPWPSNYVKRKV